VEETYDGTTDREHISSLDMWVMAKDNLHSAKAAKNDEFYPDPVMRTYVVDNPHITTNDLK